MSALKKKTTKKAPARPAAKSKSKGRAPAKGGKPVARPARRIIPAVPPLKAKSRGEKAAAKPMVVLPKLPAHLIAAIRALDEVGVTSRSESQRDSGWTVVGAFDVLFHVFREDIRKSYALEALWKDGLDIPVSAILKA